MAEETKTPETSQTSTKKLKAGSEISIDEFVQKIDLSKYTHIFKEEEVTMDILKTFNDEDLKNIGIDKYGPRKQILNSIASLEHQGKIFYSIYFQTLVISKSFSSPIIIKLIFITFLYQLCQKDQEAIRSPPSVTSTDIQQSAPPMPVEQSDALPLHPPTNKEVIVADNGNGEY